MEYLEAFYSTYDRMDVDAFEPFFTSDMTIKFANNPLIEGYETQRVAYKQFLSNFSHAKHRIKTMDIVAPRIYLALEVEWVVKKDPEQKKFITPAFTVIYPDNAEDGKRRMKDVEIYIDICEVMDRVESVA